MSHITDIYSDYSPEVNVFPESTNERDIAAYELQRTLYFHMLTYNNVLTAASLAVAAERNSINVNSEVSRAEAILNKINNEQAEIRNDRNIRITSEAGHSASIISFAQEMANQRQLGAVGITIFGVAIGIKYIVMAAIVATAAITLAIVRAMQTRAWQSQVEFNESKQVIRDILSQLDESDRAILTREINRQLQAAERRGRMRQWWATWGKITRNSLFIAAGAAGVIYGLPYLKALNNKKNG